MYNSTKEFVKWSILKLMEQCDITIDDIQIIIDEIKHTNNELLTEEDWKELLMYQKYTYKIILNKFNCDMNGNKISYKRVDFNKEDLIQKILKYGKEVDNLHTHTNID